MIKISLDTAALKQLIEDSGNEFKVELKKGILHNAIKKIIPFDTQEGVLKVARKAVAEAEKNILKFNWSDSTTVGLSDKAQKAVTKEIEKHLKKTVSNEAAKKAHALISKEYTEAYVRLEKLVKQTTDELEEKIDAIVIKKIPSTINNYISQKVEEQLTLILENAENN